MRAALSADGAELFVHAMDVLDTKSLGTNATARRLFAASAPWPRARGWGNYASGSH